MKGIEQFKKMAAAAKDARTQISGPEGFLLWESFGFPIDLTEIMVGPGFRAHATGNTTLVAPPTKRLCVISPYIQSVILPIS